MLLKEHIDTPEFVDLWRVVRQLLLLTHGQASIERGFSDNKQMKVDNLREQTFMTTSSLLVGSWASTSTKHCWHHAKRPISGIYRRTDEIGCHR